MALTLKDLKPKLVTVELELPDGTIETIQLMPLSWSQWQELGLLIETEKAPKKQSVEGGKKVYVDDLKEQRKLDAIAEMQRAKLRLAEALVRAGSAPELEGLTHEERLTALDEIDTGIMNALLIALRETALGSQGRIAEQAERFQE